MRANVHVSRTGRIKLDGAELTQADAIELAHQLAVGVQRSIDRNQLDQPAYYASAAILRRIESPLGRAITALGQVF